MARKFATLEAYSAKFGGIIATAQNTGWDGQSEQPLWEVTLQGEVSAGHMMAFARRIALASTNTGRNIEQRAYQALEAEASSDLAFRGTDLPFGIESFTDNGFVDDYLDA